MENLLDGSSLQIIFKVSLDGSAEETTAEAFSVPALNIRNLPDIPTFTEDFTGLPNTLVFVGESLNLPGMTLFFLEGQGQVGIYDSRGDYLPDMRDGPAITLGYNNTQGPLPQHVRLSFDLEFRRIKFSLANRHRQATISYFDSDGNKQGQLSLPTPPQRESRWIELTSPPRIKIKTIELEINDWIYLDNFSLWN